MQSSSRSRPRSSANSETWASSFANGFEDEADDDGGGSLVAE